MGSYIKKNLIKICVTFVNQKFMVLFFGSLTRSQLLTLPKEKDGSIAVENWTKWQVYVRQSPEDTPVVVYARTGDTVAFQNKVSIV